jgi:hypothetical protein
MTGAQRSYLKPEEPKVPFDDTLTKAQASKWIDELQKTTGAARREPSGTLDRATQLRGGRRDYGPARRPVFIAHEAGADAAR